MSKVKLSPEELERLKIHNQGGLENFKNSVNEFRQKNGMDPVEFEPFTQEVSDDMKDYIKTTYGKEAQKWEISPDTGFVVPKLTEEDIQHFINTKYK